MQNPEFHFHKPPILIRVGEMLGICEAAPEHILPANEVGRLLSKYRDLRGDPNFGIGNDGNCQSWRGHRGWWKEFLHNPS